jgi:death-on-curing protein
MLERTGGFAGIRDEGLLDSALASPFQTFGGTDLFPDVIAKISRLTFGIIKNHPFFDGNKRTGMYVMLVMLRINGFGINFSEEEIIRVGLAIANGEMDDEQLRAFIIKRLINH